MIQHAGLFPHRTVVDNVATVPVLLGRTRSEAHARAPSSCSSASGSTRSFADRYPAQLSGGQQQRVGVARALAADPPVMLMDEPFSAVDPVVRDQLQDEFLRLQAELGKTIVFVTHDIDEAIKLGDQVAVLRVGGQLAQLATPAELLPRPADAFVAGFVGRDRGYRALGFAAAGQLPLDDEQIVALGADRCRAAAAAEDGWVARRRRRPRPQGWLAVAGLSADQLHGEVTPDLLNLGGTLATEAGTLREALDAALSSPSGRGVVVARGRPLRRHRRRLAGPGPDRGTRHRNRREPSCVGRAHRRRGAATWPARHAVNASGTTSATTRARSCTGPGRRSGWPALPLIVGLLIALPLGWLASRYRWTYPPLVTMAGMLYTIPSLVLFVTLPGLSAPRSSTRSTSAVALTVYTVALLVRVVADGLSSVAAETLAGGRGDGLHRPASGSSACSCRSRCR